MELKTFLARILLVVALVTCLMSALFLLYFFLQNRIENNSIPSITSIAEKIKAGLSAGLSVPSLPARLKIPNLKIDATVEYVGLTKSGAMGVPKGPNNVAWLELSPRPGEMGSSVIDGHSGWKNGIPAVFDNLYKLKKGDRIYVEDETGMMITFVVREFKSYDPKADAKDVFASRDGQAHLNLITCEGVWNEVTKSRSKRLVVFTDRVME